ncbi:deoxycytidylate deaminase [Flavobacterium sp.]|jgi:deoxycytidylate deaminase|uniref:deoxycytidylate deaminase n=1 Tax=Flavobacterium sp. TaxID=239 RepID=UPI0037C131E3
MTNRIDLSVLNLQELIELDNLIRRELKSKHSWFNTERPSWDAYGSFLAFAVSLRGSCVRRKAGAVFMDIDHNVISTGYNGKGAGLVNCADEMCKGATATSGTALSDCEAIHAELNAALRCRNIKDLHTAYITCSPCVGCVDVLLGTPCQRIVFAEEYPHNEESKRRWTKAGREWVHYQLEQKDTSHTVSLSNEIVPPKLVRKICNEHCGGHCSDGKKEIDEHGHYD